MQKDADIFFLRQSPDIDQKKMILGNFQLLFQLPGTLWVGWSREQRQIDPRGDDMNGLLHPIAQQQIFYLFCGDDDSGGAGENHPGKCRDCLPAPFATGRKIVRVIFVNRVISVNQRGAGGGRDFPRHQEGAEFTLGMNHVRMPANQRGQQMSCRCGAESGSRVDFSGADRTDVGDIPNAIGTGRPGQCQHFYVVPLRGQLPLKIQNRSYDTVNCRCIPVCCDEYFHL
jgi:hypothetical protein